MTKYHWSLEAAGEGDAETVTGFGEVLVIFVAALERCGFVAARPDGNAIGGDAGEQFGPRDAAGATQARP